MGLVEFFTGSSHEDFGIYSERDERLSADAFRQQLSQGARLIKPKYVKFALTTSSSGEALLGYDGHCFVVDVEAMDVVNALVREQPVNASDRPATFELLRELYNHEALELAQQKESPL